MIEKFPISNFEPEQKPEAVESPDGWQMLVSLTEKYGFGRGLIENLAQKIIGESNGSLTKKDDIGIFSSQKIPTAVYYSPRLVELIEKKLPKRAPGEWVSMTSVVQKYGISMPTIIKIVEKIIEESNGNLEKERSMFPSKINNEPSTFFSPKLVELIEKKIPHEAPDGWVDRISFAEKHRINKKTIENLAQKIIGDSNENLKKIENVGMFSSKKSGNLTMYYSPRLVELIERDLPEKAPEGWSDIISLTKKYGISRIAYENRAKKIIEESKGELSEEKDTGIFWAKNHKPTKYYSAKVVESIERILPQEPPIGWIDLISLAEKYGVTKTGIAYKVNRIIEESNGNLKEDEESGIFFSKKKGPPTSYYSPKLVRLLEEDLSEKAPYGWADSNFFVNKYSISKGFIENIAQKIINESDGKLNEEMKKFSAKKMGPPAIYYSPKLVELIEKKIPHEAPDRWLSIASIAKKNQVDPNTIKSRSEKIIEESKGKLGKEAGIFFSENNKSTLFLSPKLVDLVEQSLPQQSPEGWISLVSIAEKNNVSVSIIKGIAKKIIEESNNGLGKEEKMFASKKSGLPATYFSPKLIELIEKNLPEKAPKGWESIDSLSEKIGISKEKIKRIIKGNNI